MKRAYSIEMGVLRGYATYLFCVGALISVLVGIGTQTAAVAPAILTCMYLMMGAMGAAAYDDQNGWGRYRLALPVSRRDVVLARYAAVVTLGLIGALVGLVASLAVMGIASAVDLPGGISASLALDYESVVSMLFATAVCFLVGSGVVSVVVPVYFRFGQTKATQMLPTVLVILFVAPIFLFSAFGLLDDGFFAIVSDVLEHAETLSGVMGSMVVFLASSLLLLLVSAAVSLRLYSKREL